MHRYVKQRGEFDSPHNRKCNLANRQESKRNPVECHKPLGIESAFYRKGSDKIKVKGTRRIVNYKYMYVDAFQQMEVAEGTIEVKKKCRDIRKFLTEKMEKEFGKGVILEMEVMRIDSTFEIPYEVLKNYEIKEKEN